jgi:fructose-1,6-bisphosphatase-3
MRSISKIRTGLLDQETKTLAYLRLLSKQYPTIQAVSAAIIDLTAQLNLPKGTEHFVSDLHGEYEAFGHVLRSGSGSLRRRIDEIFGETLAAGERQNLATLVAYPERKLLLILQEIEDQDAWYRETLLRLVKICRSVISKYPRNQVQAYLPEPLVDIVEELLYAQEDVEDKRGYYQSIVETIIATGSGRAFVVALAELIQRCAISRLHVVGDIYDRGPGAHHILDTLIAYQNVDIQWGNHDILWMGAAAGSEACIANVIRVCLRYANMETLERGYAISLLPLASFAVETYGDDTCRAFVPQPSGADDFTDDELRLMAQMHKAITIIQLKLEAQIIRRRPHYQMEDRLLLDKIDFDRGVVRTNGAAYCLLDTNFPTLDPNQPYALTPREKSVMERLKLSFTGSRRLQQHVRFLFSKGSIYLVHNGNLLYHGCIPMLEEGSFKPFLVGGERYSAKAFMDRVDRLARQGFFSTDAGKKQYGLDVMWYLWSGAQSPLFGKDKMATFERYFVADKSTHMEKRDPYYDLRERREVARLILEEFGLDKDEGHIINGHVPVKVKLGESPVKASGRLIVIDGGFSKAYQGRTGIAGYTLIHNSWGLLLATHQSFESTQKAIEEDVSTNSRTEILERNDVRIRVRDTDQGRDIQRRIDELVALLDAYRAGVLKES